MSLVLKIKIGFILFLFVGCQQEKTVSSESFSDRQKDQLLYEMATTYLFPLPENAADEKHPLSVELVALGRELYFEKAMSKDRSVSCNSCHPLDNYGVDNKALSKGVDGRLGRRNSPTTYNAALHLAQFWDGRVKTVEEQVEGPLLNPDEMAMPSKKAIVNRVADIPKYDTLFAQAYPHGGPIKYPQIARAIGAFERTLLTPSRLDDYLEGDLTILSEREKNGLQLMLDYGCIPCHSGHAMGGAMHQKFGIFGDYRSFLVQRNKFVALDLKDVGRMGITHHVTDEDVFKVPSLRNISHTAPYFHNGSVEKLEDAVQIMANLQLGRTLNSLEIDDIVSFLKVSSDKRKERSLEN